MILIPDYNTGSGRLDGPVFIQMYGINDPDDRVTGQGSTAVGGQGGQGEGKQEGKKQEKGRSFGEKMGPACELGRAFFQRSWSFLRIW